MKERKLMVDYSTTRKAPETTMATASRLNGSEKKPWWLSNRKIVDKYIKDARSLMTTRDKSDIATAVSLLDAALDLSPRYEVALELKARALLYLRRFKDVANMLQDYIPSLKMANDECSLGSPSSDPSQQLSKERVKLLTSGSDSSSRDPSFKCFSVSDLKKKVIAGVCKNYDKEGQWRYLVLGQACCHLGLMEDAMALLQTWKRLSTAAFRRESISWSDDSFSLSNLTDLPCTTTSPPRQPLSEFETVIDLISHVKLLLRRRAAAIAALDAGLHSEAIRHLTKILESRRGAPQGFLADCYMLRASSYRSSGRIAESIADCNKTLALDPTCIPALETRASLLESIRCLPDCLHDLEHLKLLYNSILRDRKLPGPAWKKHNVRYREIPGKLCVLTVRIQELKKRVAGGEKGANVDYHALIGIRRGCTRSELERAHRLLCLRHKPDKATSFMERCEFADDGDLDSIRDRAKMSALMLYRLIQRGYSSVLGVIKEEEMQRKEAAAALQAAAAAAAQLQVVMQQSSTSTSSSSDVVVSGPGAGVNSKSVFQGVFCRDLAIVGNLLSQVGFNRRISVEYEALSC